MIVRASLLFAFLSTPLSAQSVDTLAVAPGATLRIVTRASTDPLTTILRRQTSAGLVVDSRCKTCVVDSTIVWSAVQTVDVRAGRRHGVKSALVGAGVGLLAGTLIGAVGVHQSLQDCKSNGEDFCGLVVIALPVISATGMVVGLGTGLAIGTQRWERVWPVAPRR
jgi:hypothetical protein